MGQEAAGYLRCWRAVACSACSRCSRLRTLPSSDRFFQLFLGTAAVFSCWSQNKHVSTACETPVTMLMVREIE